MRYLVLVLVGIVAVPLALAGGVACVASIAGEWFGFHILDLSGVPIFGWLSGISLVQELYGGEASSFENYITAILGIAAASLGFGTLKALWDWASQ